MKPFFATKEQLSEIERIGKEKPLSALLVQPFMEYHRVSQMMDLTYCLADDLIQIMNNKKPMPVKEKKKRGG